MATPCEFKVGDRVGRLRPNGSLDPDYIGIVEEVEFQGPPGGGSYDCLYRVRLPNGMYFNASEGDLGKAPDA